MDDSTVVPSANTEVGTGDAPVVPNVSTSVSDAALAAARGGFSQPDADAHNANELGFAQACFAGVEPLIWNAVDSEPSSDGYGADVARFYEDVWGSVKAAVTVLIDSDGTRNYRASEETEAGDVGRNLVSQQHSVFKDICMILKGGDAESISQLVAVIEDTEKTPTWNRLRGVAKEVREGLVFEPSTYEDTLTHKGKVKGPDGKMIEKEFNIADTCASHDEITALKEATRTLSNDTKPERKGLTEAFWGLVGTDMQDKREGSAGTSTTQDTVVRMVDAIEQSPEGRQLAAKFLAKLEKLEARAAQLSR